MSSYIASIQFLIATLKELERDRHYRGLKRYVHNLKRKRYLNGKEKFILEGASYYLKRPQLDRRSRTLGLVEFIPYNERRAQCQVKTSVYVFPSPKIAGHLTTIAKVWRATLKKAGIKDFRFHDLRRSFASWLSDLGYSLQEISLLLSHSDIRVTQRYVSPDKSKLREAVESVSREKSYGLSTDFLNE